MAFAPMVGAVAGAAGTVAQISQQSRGARQQREQLKIQRHSMVQQFEALQEQRLFQKDIANAEMGRARQQIASNEALQLFNTALEERALQQAELMNQAQASAEMFEIQQTRLAEQSQAAQERAQTDTAAGAGAEELGRDIRTMQATDETNVGQEARGQGESLSSAGIAEGRALEVDQAFRQFNELFELNMETSKINQEAATRLSEMQAALGMNEAQTRDLMRAQDMAIATTQNQMNNDFIRLDTDMNEAAMDAELAARLFNIEAAQHSDQIAHHGSVAMNQANSSAAASSGPGLFGSLGALAQAGMGVYNAFTPIQAPTARVTNPLANQNTSATSTGPNFTGFAGPSLSHLPRFGSMPAPTRSGNTRSLFDIG